MLPLGAEAHHVLDTGAVVPAAIEDHDLPPRRKMGDIALAVDLRLLPVRRRRQGDDPEHARTHPLRDGLDGAALAGRVAAFQDDDDAPTSGLHPILHVADFGL